MTPEKLKAKIEAARESFRTVGLPPELEDECVSAPVVELARLATRCLDAFDAKRFVGRTGTEALKPTAAERELRTALGVPRPLGYLTNSPSPPPPEIRGADDDLFVAVMAYSEKLDTGFGVIEAQDMIRRRALLYAVAELERHTSSIENLDAASAVRHLRAKAAATRDE